MKKGIVEKYDYSCVRYVSMYIGEGEMMNMDN